MKNKKVIRDNDIDVLLEIIKNREIYKENSQNGLVILLNGTWGTGKTTFLKDFQEKVELQEDFQVFVNYNAYEYDFYENPYIPFFSSIEDKLKLGNDFEKIVRLTSKNVMQGIVASLYAFLNGYLKNKTNVDLNDFKDNIIGIENENYLKDFEEFNKCKTKIKEKIKEICKKKTQIFIIDELDRCNPNFAIETLEIIKHFFDIKNCVFVVSVDKLQLQESAKTIYGQGMNSEKYFSKFFDYQYNLLALDFYETIDLEDIYNLEKIIKQFSKLFSDLNVSLRDAKKIFNEFIIKYRKYNKENNWEDSKCLFVLFLLILKYTDLLFYTELLNGNVDKHLKKLESGANQLFNYYSKILNEHLDSNKTFSNVLLDLNIYINKEYINISKAYENVWYMDFEDGFKEKQNIAKGMFPYIPQLKPDKTFKENIEELIN